MSSELPPRQTDIPDDDNQTTSGHQGPPHALPHDVNGVQKLLIVVNVAELVRMVFVLLQCLVRRRCDR